MDPPFISSGNLLCILHALNNYLGRQHYTAPSTLNPTTLPEFCRLFAELTDGGHDERQRIILLKRTSLHIFLLANLPLPRHIFKIYKTHISNYLQDASGGYWELDSQKGIQRKIEFIEISQIEGDICAIPFSIAELYTIRGKMEHWDANRYGDMYVELKRLIICAIDMGLCQASISSAS